MAAALPRLLDLCTAISCRWDTGGDGHRRIMTEHRLGEVPLLLGFFGTAVFLVLNVRLGSPEVAARIV